MKHKNQIIIILIILFLFLQISFVQSKNSSPLQSNNNGSKIYVDDSNINGPWKGNEQYPFQTIKDAYQKAEDHDTIIVQTGYYFETLHINKSISIIGTKQNKTIIQSKNNQTIFTLNKPSISINNITFQYSGGNVNDYALSLNQHNITISYCTFHHTKSAILIQNNQHCKISNCIFYQNGDGISLFNASKITIQKSIFTHNSIGIHIEESHKITVISCHHFVNGIGIFLNDAHNCSILACALFNNNDNRGGIFMESCKHIIIDDAIIQHNGFGVKTNFCEWITLTNSSVQWNTHIGFSMFEQSKNIIISACNFTKNLRYSVRAENSQYTIKDSNFEKSLYGLYAEESQSQVINNWWGSTRGPSLFEQAKRQRISLTKGPISYIPWLKTKNMQAGASWSIDETMFDLGINFSNPVHISFDEPDDDNDGVPNWWEIKYQYDPNNNDPHHLLDPDEDGLTNIQECYTAPWDSHPFKKDIFLEFDWMETKTTGESNKPAKDYINMITESFAVHNISLHVDTGNLDGGEIIPYQSHFNYAVLQDYYWDYFLHNDMNNPRKGIFHYGLICDYGPSPGFAVIGWDHLDSFCISADWLQENQPSRDRQRLIVGGSIHELGHTLGLTVDDHGGNDNTVATQLFNKQWFKYLPYKSCMNYWYTYKILTFSDGSHGKGDFNDWENMDLSFFSHTHFDLPDIYR